mmetsp:Transcript_9483/g.24401  ORF Transcript_9483/g.24401 Transcript_9483/m.24401 type:complete len:202 (+) Transcript_9483:609-1214(+)
MPDPSQNALASCTNSSTLLTSTCRVSPPKQRDAPPAPVSANTAASANAENGEGGTGSSPGGCMYFLLHSGFAASSSSEEVPSDASATISAQAPTNSPATPSPGRGRPTSGLTVPPRRRWKNAGVNGSGTTKPSRTALAISLPSMQKRNSTAVKLGDSGGRGRTRSPRRGVRKSSLSGGSSSTHIGALRFAVRRCSSWATSV